MYYQTRNNLEDRGGGGEKNTHICVKKKKQLISIMEYHFKTHAKHESRESYLKFQAQSILQLSWALPPLGPFIFHLCPPKENFGDKKRK